MELFLIGCSVGSICTTVFMVCREYLIDKKWKEENKEAILEIKKRKLHLEKECDS